jgi:HK97 family phage major capsid protein
VTIAHFIKVSTQMLADIPYIQGQVDGRLRYGLELVEEHNIVNGDGQTSSGELLGIMPQATAYAPVGTGNTMIDTVRKMMIQATLALYIPTGVVLHPQDWGAIELLKNTLGNYLIGDPQGTTAPRLWGLPVAQSFEIGANKVLVGAFAQGAEIFDREEGNVQLAFTNEDDFVRNLATLRAEERVGLAVYRPAAFIKGDFTAMQAA